MSSEISTGHLGDESSAMLDENMPPSSGNAMADLFRDLEALRERLAGLSTAANDLAAHGESASAEAEHTAGQATPATLSSPPQNPSGLDSSPQVAEPVQQLDERSGSVRTLVEVAGVCDPQSSGSDAACPKSEALITPQLEQNEQQQATPMSPRPLAAPSSEPQHKPQQEAQKSMIDDTSRINEDPTSRGSRHGESEDMACVTSGANNVRPMEIDNLTATVKAPSSKGTDEEPGVSRHPDTTGRSQPTAVRSTGGASAVSSPRQMPAARGSSVGGSGSGSRPNSVRLARLPRDLGCYRDVPVVTEDVPYDCAIWTPRTILGAMEHITGQGAQRSEADAHRHRRQKIERLHHLLTETNSVDPAWCDPHPPLASRGRAGTAIFEHTYE